ncbi:Rv3235 family protein [Streptomyces blattellae]|uniref:Rv3235 family protein n=1 Tax=Streptomyces blattellae TaxID=2569855 RepID=UPI0012B9448D|nr:Rv3235 family protein [Streptomyces blattellae]
MNKVMTRANHNAGTRPPGRRDTRRPGGTPPRTPSSTAARTRTRSEARTTSATASHTAPPAASAAVPPQTPPKPAQRPRPTDVFADRLLLVLSGQRPVHWMLGHTAGRAYDELARLAEHGLLRTRGTRPVVRDIGYYIVHAGAVEAFARIGAGDELRAMAFRLEKGLDLRWRCTAVELDGRRTPEPVDD